MTYEQALGISQLVASGLFLCVLAGVAFYAFRPANKASFEHAARLPLDTRNPSDQAVE